MTERQSELIVVIDTSTRHGGVAVWDTNKEVASLTWESEKNHTAELMPAVEHVIRVAKTCPIDLSGVGVALGPGGFSSLRVGISVAKGLAIPLQLPIIGVSTLEIEAYWYRGMGFPIRPVLDAGRGGIATAMFQLLDDRWEKLEEERICFLEDIVHDVSQPTIFCGDGVMARVEAIRALCRNAIILSNESSSVRLWSLGLLSGQRFHSNRAMDMNEIQPLYLRKPNIGTPKEPKRASY